MGKFLNDISDYLYNKMIHYVGNYILSLVGILMFKLCVKFKWNTTMNIFFKDRNRKPMGLGIDIFA